MCKEYNGWANYPTWNIALWLDNDQGLQECALDVARRNFEFEYERDTAFRELVEELLTYDAPDVTGMRADLLFWVIRSVDWRAISEAYKEQVAEC